MRAKGAPPIAVSALGRPARPSRAPPPSSSTVKRPRPESCHRWRFDHGVLSLFGRGLEEPRAVVEGGGRASSSTAQSWIDEWAGGGSRIDTSRPTARRRTSSWGGAAGWGWDTNHPTPIGRWPSSEVCFPRAGPSWPENRNTLAPEAPIR